MEKLDFGTKLIEVRKAKGLTQDEVAEKCKITVRTIQRIESGLVTPRAFTIKIISENLGFDFFETSNTGYKVLTENQSSSLEYHKILWYLKDLINLKNNKMKKLSILTSVVTITVCALFILILNVQGQTENKLENKSKNPITSAIRRTGYKLEVAFTNNLTLDSLLTIKNTLQKEGIVLKYNKLEFDRTDHLSGIDGHVTFGKYGSSGTFAMGMLDSVNKLRNIGFFLDYAKDAKPRCGITMIK